MLRFSSVFAVVGFVVSLLLDLFAYFLNYYLYPHFRGNLRATLAIHQVADRIYLMLWPTSIGLMGLDNASAGGQVIGLLILAFTNAVLYFILGAMFWCGIAKHKALLALPILLIAVIWYRLAIRF